MHRLMNNMNLGPVMISHPPTMLEPLLIRATSFYHMIGFTGKTFGSTFLQSETKEEFAQVEEKNKKKLTKPSKSL